MKVIIVGGMSAHDLEALMDEDLDVHHDDHARPAATLDRLGDAMPGFGIVAAVLGIVITMGSIGGPPAEIGHKVGAALVGTFLGILLSYGFVQPLAPASSSAPQDEAATSCIKAGLLATFKGFAPAIAVEFARRVLPDDVRPDVRGNREFCRSVTRGSESAAAGGVAMEDQPVIIIKKKKGGHGGHHGGAWKVAYADFVTAMMAFFLVMWLVAQSKDVKANIAGYFRDPGLFDYQKSNGLLPSGGAPGVSPGKPSDPGGKPDQTALMKERAMLAQAADHIRDGLVKVPEFKTLRDQIESTVTTEGLRIELVSDSGSSFFDSGSAVLRGESMRMLAVIAGELAS